MKEIFFEKAQYNKKKVLRYKIYMLFESKERSFLILLKYTVFKLYNYLFQTNFIVINLLLINFKYLKSIILLLYHGKY